MLAIQRAPIFLERFSQCLLLFQVFVILPSSYTTNKWIIQNTKYNSFDNKPFDKKYFVNPSLLYFPPTQEDIINFLWNGSLSFTIDKAEITITDKRKYRQLCRSIWIFLRSATIAKFLGPHVFFLFFCYTKAVLH